MDRVEFSSQMAQKTKHVSLSPTLSEWVTEINWSFNLYHIIIMSTQYFNLYP